jgi:hypothetical protein
MPGAPENGGIYDLRLAIYDLRAAGEADLQFA